MVNGDARNIHFEANRYKLDKVYGLQPKFISVGNQSGTSEGYNYFSHIQEEYEFIYLHSGYVDYYCENDRMRACAGDMYFIQPNQRHKEMSGASDLEFTYVKFNVYNYKGERVDSLTSNKKEQLIKNVPENIKSNFVKIFNEMKGMRFGFKQIIESAIIELLIYIERYHHKDEEIVRGNTMSIIISSIIDEIEMNVGAKYSVPELAKKYCISASALAHSFTKIMGKPLMMYITERKIKHAEYRLSSTADTIKYIAQSLGFSSVPYFNRVFKKLTDYSPSEYRKFSLSYKGGTAYKMKAESFKKIKFSDKPAPVAELLSEYRLVKKIYATDKISFSGAEGMDVYNISRPFIIDGKEIIAGRVEARDSEISVVRFFERKSDNSYVIVPDIELPMLQDPFVSNLNGQTVVGGTKIFCDNERITSWATVFFKGDSLNTLEEFASAPMGMKDVRFIEHDGRLAVFTRPQGGVACLGKIGFMYLENETEITPANLLKARLLLSHFKDDEWGGANELFVLENGLIGVLGHISCRDSLKKLHYYPIVFAFDPKTLKSTRLKIIAERSDFKAGAKKRDDLEDVLFSGGLLRRPDGTAALYTGVSDAEAHFIVINDPFKEYEQ